MKDKVRKPTNFAREKGITLIALIITIIVLVILAAVSISAVYNSKIINYATNGAVDYATESVKENEILDKTTSLMESAISNIESINAGNGDTSGSTEEPDEGDEEEPEPPPEEEPEVGIDFGNMTEDEIINNYVGKYVDYTPVSGSFKSERQYNEHDNQNFSTDMSVKWKILCIEDNRLTLISDKAVHNGFYLGGANGYNNGVLLLNNACKAMYSNDSVWAIGKSLNIDYIEKYMIYDKTSYSNYGKEYSPNNTKYPVIFEEEKTGAPNGTYGTKYGLSDQDNYVTGTSSSNHLLNPLEGKCTYYTFTMSESTMKNKTYVDLFSSSVQFWLASRCVDFNVSYAFFRMFFVNSATVDATKDSLYHSGGSSTKFAYAIRPIVEIDLTKVNVGLTGTGAENDGYSLTLK